MSKIVRVKKKNKAITRKNYSVFENIINEKYKVVLVIIAIISILMGSILYDKFAETSLIEIINDKIELFKTDNLLRIFLFLFKTDILYFLITMFIGTSFIGTPLIILPISLKCLVTGYLGAYMYNEFELKGVLFCLLFVFPYTAITTTSLLFASNESVYMSKTCLNAITNKNTADNISVKLYILRYLILIIINGVCALFNSALIVLFINKINL